MEVTGFQEGKLAFQYLGAPLALENSDILAHWWILSSNALTPSQKRHFLMQGKFSLSALSCKGWNVFSYLFSHCHVEL